MKFRPYKRAARKFLAARILVPFVIAREHLIEAVAEHLYFEPDCLPLVRRDVQKLVRERKSSYGTMEFDGDSDDDFVKAVKVVDRLFPELKAYEEKTHVRM